MRKLFEILISTWITWVNESIMVYKFDMETIMCKTKGDRK